MFPKEEYLDRVLADWKKEQYHIANQAIVPEDASWDGHDPYVFSLFDRSNNTTERKTNDYRYKNIPNDDSHTEKLYGGVDVSFAPQNDKSYGNKAVAVYVVVKGTTIVYQDWELFELKVPYISSYLAFREIDPLERLVKRQLKDRPEVTPEAILVDGNGILHCRRAGIAVFLGVKTGLPTIGVGKSFYYNTNDGENESGEGITNNYLTREVVEMSLKINVERFRKHFYQKLHCCDNIGNPNSKSFSKCGLVIGEETISDKSKSPTDLEGKMKSKSEWEETIQEISRYCTGFASKLEMNGNICGAIIVGHGGKCNPKLQIGTKNPIYVSIGNNISLEKALEICSNLSYSRIPEPVRRADLIGRELMRNKSIF